MSIRVAWFQLLHLGTLGTKSIWEPDVPAECNLMLKSPSCWCFPFNFTWRGKHPSHVEGLPNSRNMWFPYFQTACQIARGYTVYIMILDFSWDIPFHTRVFCWCRSSSPSKPNLLCLRPIFPEVNSNLAYYSTNYIPHVDSEIVLADGFISPEKFSSSGISQR